MVINKSNLPEDRLPIVEVPNVKKSDVLGNFELPVFSDVNLKIKIGEFLATMGPSDSEERTLVNFIGCLDRPTQGQVLEVNLLTTLRSFLRMSPLETLTPKKEPKSFEQSWV